MGRPGPAGPGSVAYLELRLAGAFRVVRDGDELADGEIGSRKSRTLLKLLAVERPALVPVDRIVAILWPDDPPAAPEQNVATLVSRLRAALGADLIQGGRAGYRLASGPSDRRGPGRGGRVLRSGRRQGGHRRRGGAGRRGARARAAGRGYRDRRRAVRGLGGSGPGAGTRAAAPGAAGGGRGGPGDRGSAAGGGLRGGGHHRRPARRGCAPLVHVGFGRGRRAGEGARRLRGAPPAARRANSAPTRPRRPGSCTWPSCASRTEHAARGPAGAAPGPRACGRGRPARDLAGGTPLAGRDGEIRVLRAGVGCGRRRAAGAGDDRRRGGYRQDRAGRGARRRGRRGRRDGAADPLLRDRAIAVPPARRGGDRAGRSQDPGRRAAGAARRARDRGRRAAARGGGHPRPAAARTDQHGDGAAARLRGAPGHPARPG